MFRLRTDLDRLLLATTFISSKKSPQTIIASGFFYTINKRVYLVTTKHVFQVNQITHWVAHTHTKDKDLTVRSLIRFHTSDIRIPPSGEDAAIVDFTDRLKNSIYCHFERSAILSDAELLLCCISCEAIYMAGAGQVYDKMHHFPLVRNGICATHPGLTWNDKNEGVASVVTFIGDSGGPVVFTTAQRTIIDGGKQYTLPSGTYLLGFHIGPAHTDKTLHPDTPTHFCRYTKSTILTGDLSLWITASSLESIEPSVLLHAAPVLSTTTKMLKTIAVNAHTTAVVNTALDSRSVVDSVIVGQDKHIVSMNTTPLPDEHTLGVLSAQSMNAAAAAAVGTTPHPAAAGNDGATLEPELVSSASSPSHLSRIFAAHPILRQRLFDYLGSESDVILRLFSATQLMEKVEPRDRLLMSALVRELAPCHLLRHEDEVDVKNELRCHTTVRSLDDALHDALAVTGDTRVILDLRNMLRSEEPSELAPNPTLFVLANVLAMLNRAQEDQRNRVEAFDLSYNRLTVSDICKDTTFLRILALLPKCRLVNLCGTSLAMPEDDNLFTPFVKTINALTQRCDFVDISMTMLASVDGAPFFKQVTDVCKIIFTIENWLDSGTWKAVLRQRKKDSDAEIDLVYNAHKAYYKLRVFQSS